MLSELRCPVSTIGRADHDEDRNDRYRCCRTSRTLIKFIRRLRVLLLTQAYECSSAAVLSWSALLGTVLLWSCRRYFALIAAGYEADSAVQARRWRAVVPCRCGGGADGGRPRTRGGVADA